MGALRVQALAGIGQVMRQEQRRGVRQQRTTRRRDSGTAPRFVEVVDGKGEVLASIRDKVKATIAEITGTEHKQAYASLCAASIVNLVQGYDVTDDDGRTEHRVSAFVGAWKVSPERGISITLRELAKHVAQSGRAFAPRIFLADAGPVRSVKADPLQAGLADSFLSDDAE